MTAAGDVTVAPDSQGNVKLHPYLVTLVRWCVSCLWSTATVFLHRLMITPLHPITGPRPPSAKPRVLKRAAGTEHLHPEPRVECQLLHQPRHHTLDVIFVHGLYGSLGNTWRQGDWRSKYEKAPKKVVLRDHSKKTCICQNTHPQTNRTIDNENKCNNESKCSHENKYSNDNKCSNDEIYATDLDSEMTFKRINEKLFKKIIPKENELITEQFYNNTLLDQIEIVDNYETQAKFVRDLFKRENCDNDCDANDNGNKCINNEYKCSETCQVNCSYSDNENKCKINEVNECKCKVNECKCSDKKCEIGCGCVCDACYSTCWPKDWIKMDFPGARVISINYTSDPYLWRPLWIKENKRLSLHIRADQMMHQLMEMGVGQKPIVWVGHSKGGLFIKQIYCEAYEAYKKLNKSDEIEQLPMNNTIDLMKRSNSTNNDDVIAETIDNIVGNMFHNKQMYKEHDNMTYNDYKKQNGANNETKLYKLYEKERHDDRINKMSTEGRREINENEELTSLNVILNDNENKCKITDSNGNLNETRNNEISSTIDEVSLSVRASLYSQSRGFMFYSVPHRGSPLADIKTPVTKRSLELLEISKDCPLVLNLQARWLEASGERGGERSGKRGGERSGRPAVRGFVETCRTLMSVLWLRIVSVDSADAGVGTLLGVSVDHREICKPSSRHCMLYTELKDLIHEALNKCECPPSINRLSGQ